MAIPMCSSRTLHNTYLFIYAEVYFIMVNDALRHTFLCCLNFFSSNFFQTLSSSLRGNLSISYTIICEIDWTVGYGITKKHRHWLLKLFKKEPSYRLCMLSRLLGNVEFLTLVKTNE